MDKTGHIRGADFQVPEGSGGGGGGVVVGALLL